MNRNLSHFPTRGKTFYTLQFKIDACERAANTSVRAAARALNISPRNIRRWRGSAGLIRVFPIRQRRQRLTIHRGPPIRCGRPDVDVRYIPKLCTGLIQPLDVAVIRSFKHRIRELMNNHNYETHEVTREVLSNWVKEAWQAVPNTVVRNSFNRIMNDDDELMDLE